MKTKYYLTAGTLFCSALSGLALPMVNTFAEGASSSFDYNAQECIIDSYNSETSSSVTTIEEVDFTKITTLECSNRNIVNFRGITLFPELETLDISYNQNLQIYNMNFSQNTKLKSIDVRGLSADTFDFTKNTELEAIETDRDLYLYTPAYIEKMNDDEEYAYGMDISVLKFIDPADITDTTLQDYPSIYDSTANTITYEKDIPNNVYIATNSYAFYINSRGGYMRYAIYLNGDEEVETHNPLFVNNNCEKTSNDYYICDDAIYYGDVIDTEDIVENTLAKIFNLSDYTLTSVKIVPPTANLNLTTDTDTVKKGTALADAGFTLEFYFDLDEDVKTPDTGFFTANNKGLIAGISTITLSVTSIIVYLSRYLINRQKAKVKFN